MTKQRTLSEAETKARNECGGLTRREFRAANSKFQRPAKPSSGSFEVVALFEGNPVEQAAPFPTLEAALARFIRLSTNEQLQTLKVIENKTAYNGDGKAIGMRRNTTYALTKTGQEFANSKTTAIYKAVGGNTMLTMKAIKASPRLTEDFHLGKLEVVSYHASGGQAWWERRA